MIWVMPSKTLSARTQFAYSGGENPVWTKELNNMLVLQQHAGTATTCWYWTWREREKRREREREREHA
jgi:hypothetical protein